MLNVQDAAPDFELSDQNGNIVRLSDLRGKKVVLYFYPTDDTPGCTTQACGIRDSYGELGKRAVILGVSPDSVKSHKKFEEKFSLPFPLLADTGHAVAQRYGAWKEKSMYGKKYFGIERTTFIIDEEGRVANIFEKVKADRHTEQLLEALG